MIRNFKKDYNNSNLPYGAIELQEPADELVNPIRQSCQNFEFNEEPFINPQLASEMEENSSNGNKFEIDNPSARMKYLITQNEKENIDFISTLIRLKNKNDNNLTSIANLLNKPDDESKSYIKEILDICDNKNPKEEGNVLKDLEDDSQVPQLISNNDRVSIMHPAVENQKNNKTTLKTEELVEIANRRKNILVDSMTSMDPYLRRRHMETLAKMEKIKKDNFKKEFGENAFTPAINKKSKQICNKMTSGKYQTINFANNICETNPSIKSGLSPMIKKYPATTIKKERRSFKPAFPSRYEKNENGRSDSSSLFSNSKGGNLSNIISVNSSTVVKKQKSIKSNKSIEDLICISDLSNNCPPNVNLNSLIKTRTNNDTKSNEVPNINLDLETELNDNFKNDLEVEQNMKNLQETQENEEDIPVENRLFYSTEDLENQKKRNSNRRINIKEIKKEVAEKKRLEQEKNSSLADMVNYNSLNTRKDAESSSIIKLPAETENIEFQIQENDFTGTNPTNMIDTGDNFYPQASNFPNESFEGDSSVNEYSFRKNVPKHNESKEIRFSQIPSVNNGSINLSKLTNFVDYASNNSSKRSYTPKTNYYNSILNNTKSRPPVPHKIKPYDEVDKILRRNKNIKENQEIPLSGHDKKRKFPKFDDSEDFIVTNNSQRELKVSIKNTINDTSLNSNNNNLLKEEEKAKENESIAVPIIDSKKEDLSKKYDQPIVAEINLFDGDDDEEEKPQDQKSIIKKIKNSIEPIEESNIEFDIDDLLTPKYIFEQQPQLRKHLSKSFCGATSAPSKTPTREKVKKTVTKTKAKIHTKSVTSISNKNAPSSNAVSTNSNTGKKFSFKSKRVHPPQTTQNEPPSTQNIDNYYKNIFKKSPVKLTKGNFVSVSDLISDSLRVQMKSQMNSQKKIKDDLNKIEKTQDQSEKDIKNEISKLNLNANDLYGGSLSSFAIKNEAEKELNKNIF